MTSPEVLAPELIPISDLKPHPRNYRKHPPAQLEHIKESIREHGVYRNVVTARDLTIVAGHGVVKAALEMGITHLNVIRLPVGADDARALKLLAGDNEIGRMGVIDDRALTDMLMEIRNQDPEGLLGTGFDDTMLAAFTMVTRPRGEIASFDAAAHWVGMPGFDQGSPTTEHRLIVRFRTEQDREAFIAHAGLDHEMIRQSGNTCTSEWPQEPRDDLINVRVEPTDG